jgi:4-amino-4-deoxy-L-arabinose transferase-like glycosyltransferase
LLPVSRRTQRILLASLSAIAFLAFLGGRDIVTSHEARVAQTAREMAVSGWPWSAQSVAVPPIKLVEQADRKRLVAQRDQPPLHVNPWAMPVINREVRVQKPPLPYWCVAVLYRLLDINETVARLPGAILGALATLLVFDVARIVSGRRVAWIAALVWVSSYFVTDEFRKAMADPYLAFFALACFWAWIRASGGLTITAYVFLGLGLLAKGPPMLVAAGAPIALYHLLGRRRPLGRWWTHVAGAALLLALVLPWPIYVLNHMPNAVDLWRYESVGELTGENVEKERAWWFYLPQLPQIALPWTALLLVGLLLPWRRRGDSRRRSLLPVLWYLSSVALFSLLHVKKNAYLLPAMAAQTLIVAQVLGALLAALRRGAPWARAVVRIQLGIGLAFGIVTALLVVFRPLDRPSGPLGEALAQVVIQGLQRADLAQYAAGLLALAAGLAPLLVWRRGHQRSWLAWQGASYVVLILTFFTGYEAAYSDLRSPRPFAAEVQRVLRAPDTALSRYQPQEAALFYLPVTFPDDPSSRHILVIVEDRRKGEVFDRAFFAPHVPGRTIRSVAPVRLKTESAYNRWRLHQLTVE